MQKNNLILRNRQKSLLTEIKTVVKVLNKNKIDYFILGGTALGAVRHFGFIPWDDDIDIGIPRSQYRKFEKILYKFYSKNNIFIFEKSDFHLYPSPPFATLKPQLFSNYNKNPGIDFFPLDDVPSNKFLILVQLAAKNLYHLAVYKNLARNRGKLLSFLSALFLLVVPDFLLTIFGFYAKKIMISFNSGSDGLVGNLFGMHGIKEIMPKNIFGVGIDLKFENTYLKAPVNCDKYLTLLYGDYMKLPNKDNRFPKHL